MLADRLPRNGLPSFLLFRLSTRSPSIPGLPPFAITCLSAASRTSLRHTSEYRLHAFHFGLFLACRYRIRCNFRTPVAVSSTVGVVIPCGPSPRSLSVLDSSVQLPRLRSTSVTEASSLLRRTLTPVFATVPPSLLRELCGPLANQIRAANRSPGLPWLPFPACHPPPTPPER